MRANRSSPVRTMAALARIRMTEAERRAAEDSLVKGELVADVIIGAATMVSRAIRRFRRGLRSLTGLRSSS